MLKLQFKDNPSRAIWLVGENLRIGTDSQNDVVLEGLGVQPLHAEIAIDGDTLHLKSHAAGSCYVNDLPVDANHSLAAGDELRIGTSRLLIVDPKQQFENINSNDVTGRVAQAVNQMAATTGWRLVAQHAKLKDRQFPINGNCIVGRSKEVALSIPYKLLSRQHAEFSIDGDQLHLQDLGSSNGCFVNGEQVTQARLNGGETVAFAKLAFTVVAPVKKNTVTAGDDEINKTMMRPAISLDSVDTALAAQRHKPAAEPQVMAADTDAKPTERSSNNKWFGVIGLMLVMIVAAGAWLLL